MSCRNMVMVHLLRCERADNTMRLGHNDYLHYGWSNHKHGLVTVGGDA